MSNQIFNFNSRPVRIEAFDNQPYFCLLDVCRIFNIRNSRRVQSQMLDPQGVRLAYILANDEKQHKTAFINEPNLYRIIFRSEKPIAKEFQNWVFEEVLPQIRKTGKYEVQPQQLALPEVAHEINSILQNEDALALFIKLYSYGELAHEMQAKLKNTNLYSLIESTIGGHYLYNFQYPLAETLNKAKMFIQSNTEQLALAKAFNKLLR